MTYVANNKVCFIVHSYILKMQGHCEGVQLKLTMIIVL